MRRQDQRNVTVKVQRADSTWRDLGVFDRKSGGQTDSEETKHRPGGMGPEESLGGFVTMENVVVSRVPRPNVDTGDLLGFLRARVGKAQAQVTEQFLDADGNPIGNPQVFGGILKRVTTPEHDSSSSDKAWLELEVSTHSTVGG
jgi:hypothetical protein